MFRGSNPVKSQRWAERLERFGKSKQTVAQFCQAEGVSMPSFYQWKKKLGGAKTDSPKRVNCHGRRRKKSSQPAKSPVFKPVDISPLEKTAAATIRLPNGTVVELRNDLLAIEKVMNQLLDHHSSGGADGC